MFISVYNSDSLSPHADARSRVYPHTLTNTSRKYDICHTNAPLFPVTEDLWIWHLSHVPSVAAIPEAVWMIGTIKDKGPDTAGKWSVMDLPKVDGGEYSVSNGGSDLTINAKTDYPDEAKDFVKFAMTDTKLQASGFEKYGLYPSYIPSYEEEIFQKGDSFFGDTNIYEIFIENGKNVAEIPISPNAQEAGDSIGAAVSKIFLNGADVKSTMKDLEDELTTKFK